MTSTCPAFRPISSPASRSAVNSGPGSPGSARPPGKLICPEWLRSWEVRCVNSTVRPPGCATTGTSTEAGVSAPCAPASSSPYTEGTGGERRRSRSFSPAAFAFHCPADMKKIDAALANKPQLSAQQMAEVQKYRAEGEALHKAGKHQDSVDTLARAMKILNIK